MQEKMQLCKENRIISLFEEREVDTAVLAGFLPMGVRREVVGLTVLQDEQTLRLKYPCLKNEIG